MDIKISKWRDRQSMLNYIRRESNINIISITYEQGAYNPYVFYYTVKNENTKKDI